MNFAAENTQINIFQNLDRTERFGKRHSLQQRKTVIFSGALIGNRPRQTAAIGAS